MGKSISIHLLYSPLRKTLPQAGAKLDDMLFAVPWGHRKCLIDKCSNNPEKVEGTIPTIEEIEAKLSERREAEGKK